jgi:uncharacterized protein (TIGR02453 family)
MITKEVFDFLKELKENNTRDWFTANKKNYEKQKKSVEAIITQLITDVHSFDSEIIGITYKDCMFRINRDIRFSNDKSPYKTNFGGFIAKGGRNSMNAGYYLHIEPGGSFIGGGIYMPPADKLKLVRNEIYFNVEEFKKIITDKDFIRYFKEIWDDNKLKNAPKDFPKDYPDIELLKFKNYTVIHKLDDNQLLLPDFRNYIIEVFKAMYPLNRFINRGLSNI